MEKKKGFVYENGIYELSEYEKERIKYGREQHINGNLISDEEVEKEIGDWLNSKKALQK